MQDMPKAFESGATGRVNEPWFGKKIQVALLVWYLFVGGAFSWAVIASYADRLRALLAWIQVRLP